MPDKHKMTRDQMQTEAMIIETLLTSVMALNSAPQTEDTFTLIDMAHNRACRLNQALDRVNAPEEAA